MKFFMIKYTNFLILPTKKTMGEAIINFLDKKDVISDNFPHHY